MGLWQVSKVTRTALSGIFRVINIFCRSTNSSDQDTLIEQSATPIEQSHLYILKAVSSHIGMSRVASDMAVIYVLQTSPMLPFILWPAPLLKQTQAV